MAPTIPLSLHHLTLPDVTPLDFAKLAAEAGFSGVSVCVHAIGPGLPILTKAESAEMRRILDGEGLTLTSTCDCIVASAFSLESHREALSLTAELGAKRMIVVAADADEAEAVENMAAFGALAGEYGLNVEIEFLALTPKFNSLEQALDLVSKVNADNVNVLVDMVHFVRNGGDASRLPGMDLSRVSYMHICDGPPTIAPDDVMAEIMEERILPGEGSFPIVEMLRAVPRGIVLEVEMPMKSLALAGVSPAARAAKVMESTRKVLDQAYGGA